MNEYIKTIIYGITTSWQSKLNKLAKELRAYVDGLVSPLTKKIAKAQTTAGKAQTAADAAQTTADAAQTTADKAQTTADKAQTTADNAQATADAALPLAGGEISGNLSVNSLARKTKLTGGQINILTSTGTKVLSITDSSITYDGISIASDLQNGSDISIKQKSNTSGLSMLSLSSTGIRCWANDSISPLKVNGGLSIINGDLFLKSSTANSTKQFRITVDDSGTLSATEVT